VCLEDFDVVEVGLPVFNDAVLVAREEPVVAVGVLGDADGTVVGLHDGFEIEPHAVPKGEFAGGGAGQEAPAFGGPLDEGMGC